MRWAWAFVLSFGFWLLLTWPPGWQELSVGLVAAVVATTFFGRMLRLKTVRRLFDPRRYFWAICYVLVLIYRIFVANLDVAYRVLHPEMPIKPGIVKVKTVLQNEVAKTVLANSITLTPGTLSVDITDDGYLYVHWINVRAMQEEEASSYIVGRFESLLRRIFE
ncbi:MAG: Na+/H+ antiporter subunit E [Candidatus Acetothermia bacterium]|jgi:multicomponent Na+:H+ antiporter subunit E|nr:Na+/H+ antiporter subunit E [Candidatus Acetothermia bacterium]MDH7504754.1 Na+/H+ antiporter subunit E [Candidatus Acetothermia bacterium]